MRRVLVLTAAMAVMLALAAPATGVPASTVGPVEVVAPFDASLLEFPEGVALDKPGNIYVSLGVPFFAGGGYGEIRQIDPDGTETPLVEYPTGPAGLAVDAPGNVYFAVPDPGGEAAGVYRVTDDGAERLPGTETMFVPNGLAIDKRGNVFASDSITGAIWRSPRGGTTPAQIWMSDPLLAGCGEPDPIGANGIAFWKGDLYVANTAQGTLVRIPVSNDGAPGTPTIIAGDEDCEQDDALYSLDGIAFDVHGDVYASLVLQNKLVRIDPEQGSFIVLLDEEDGLWNPASLAFGTGKGDRKSLFITNYALLPPEPANSLGPAVLKVDVGVPGLPLP